MESKKYQRLDESKDFLSTESIEFKHGSSQTQSRKCYSKMALIVGCVLICVAVVSLSILFVLYPSFGHHHQDDSDILKYQLPVKGRDNVMQHVRSSVKQNFVQYYIEVSATEKTWILDDFNTNLQVIKSVTEGHPVCFVSKFNMSQVMLPTDVQPEFSPYKEHFHGVYTPDEEPTDDHSFLGAQARELCSDANLYWMRPMDMSEFTDTTNNNNSSLTAETGSGRRVKRNISHCYTSCCRMVCCCNVRQFVWESSEHFTCTNTCDKCSPKFKHYEIRKIC